MSDNINPDHYKRLPAEAIEIIESAIDKAPSSQDAYLHGQVLKYVLRCWSKNGIEDLRKAKWYLNRLVESFEANEPEQLATGEVTVEVTGEVKPPDGWRWLEVGEVIRKGDRCFTNHGRSIDCLTSVGEKFNHDAHYPTIRRNRFEVGEKVVENIKQRIGIVKEKIGCVKSPCEYRVEMLDTKSERYFFPHHLAPYIEETK